jgi:hypothetical protein
MFNESAFSNDVTSLEHKKLKDARNAVYFWGKSYLETI